MTVLLIAFGFQAAGYEPCELCLWQRYPYFIAVAFGVPFILSGRFDHRIALAVFVVIFALDAAIALFHVGVEAGLWKGLDTCSGIPDLSGLSVEEKLALLSDTPPVPCDKPAWTLFGISMAGYNAFIALTLTLYSGLILLKSRKRISL